MCGQCRNNFSLSLIKMQPLHHDQNLRRPLLVHSIYTNNTHTQQSHTPHDKLRSLRHGA